VKPANKAGKSHWRQGPRKGVLIKTRYSWTGKQFVSLEKRIYQCLLTVGIIWTNCWWHCGGLKKKKKREKKKKYKKQKRK
jgi:hypothetical protein